MTLDSVLPYLKKMLLHIIIGAALFLLLFVFDQLDAEWIEELRHMLAWQLF